MPKVAVGEPLCAIAVTEPDTGSDVAAMRLKATKCEGGWILDGVKTWCTMAGKAGVLLVLARSNPDRSLGHKGLSMFLVENDSYDAVSYTHLDVYKRQVVKNSSSWRAGTRALMQTN